MNEPQEFLIGIPGVGIFRLICPECSNPGFKLSRNKRYIICGNCGKDVAEKDDVLTLSATNPETKNPRIH